MAKGKATKAAKKQAAPKRAPGRPSMFTPVLAERICRLIAAGSSRRKIEEMPGMPNRETIGAWLAADAEFSSQYARACEARAIGWAEEIVDIADEATDHAKARNQIEARKWYASKVARDKFGDKVKVEHRLTLEELVGKSLEPSE